MRYIRHNGFTLLEMSVVLVIIALLIGGIVIGKSLIRAAEFQSITSDVAKYTQAVTAFQEKYHALPGDMAEATSYWGTDAGGCPGAYTATPGVATCNGDGNGHIADYMTSSGLNEMYRAWQHLTNAEMIEGVFTGRPGSSGTSHSMVGINVPTSKIDGAGYTLMYLPVMNVTGTFWQGTYHHSLVYGKTWPNNITADPALLPLEAMTIDQKIDDGLPAYGNLRSVRPLNLSDCTTTTTASTAAYKQNFSGDACALVFLLGF